MALSATGMKDAIMAQLSSAGVAQPDNADVVWEAICAGIVAHLTSQGVVNVVVTPADVALQTSTAAGAPTAGPAVPVGLSGTLS